MEEEGMADVLTPQIEWSLFDEGMDVLERAGLAGLYLSLSAADEWAEKRDETAIELKEKLHWKLEDTKVALFWEDDNELEILTMLINWSWQIRDGVYYLPGVHRSLDLRENVYLRLQTHCGIMGTFLQPRGKPSVPKVEKEARYLLIQLDDDPRKTVALKYQCIKGREKVRQLMLLSGTPKKKKIYPLRERVNKRNSQNESTKKFRDVLIPGWVQPGVAKRFGPNDYDWAIKTDKALLLLFVPIAAFYLKLPSEKSKKRMRDNWAFVIPQIHSLKKVAEKYPALQKDLQTRFERVNVSGLGDAGLRFAAAYSGRISARKIKAPTIYVTAMGVTDYYSSSPTIMTRIRKNVFELKPLDYSISRYNKVMRIFPNVYIELAKDKSKDDSEDTEVKATHRMKRPSSRGRIAENIINNRPWYLDLNRPLKWQVDSLENQRRYRDDNISIERLWFEKLRYEWRNLMNLVNEENMWDSKEEKAFVEIVHVSLRRFLDKEEKALERGGSRNLRKRWEDRVEMIRRYLMHAKTLNLTRKIFTELFAEAGGSKELTQNKEMVWRFITHSHDWQKARDLGLLALVTFTDGRLAQDKSN